MSYGYIYLIRDHFTNKVYVGQKKGAPESTQNYFGSGRIITNIIAQRKHLLEKIILGYCESMDELNNAEKLCIEFFQSNNRIYGYNLTNGGEGFSGYHFSDEHKKHLRKNKKMPPRSIEHQRKLNESHTGKKRGPLSEEHKQKLRDAKINYVPWNNGKHLSEEHKRKISESNKRSKNK